MDDFGAFRWLAILEQQPLTVPDGEEHELVDRLLDMPVLPRLELPDELRLEEVRCEPVPFLTIGSPRGSKWSSEWLEGEVHFDYMGTLIPASSPRWAIVQREAGRSIVRDRQRESAAWAQLQESGFRRRLGPKRQGRAVEINARDLGPAVRALTAAGWEVRADGKQVRRPGEISFRVRSGIDWFELHADVDFEGRTIPFPELLSALARGDSTVRLDDGSLGIVPEEWIRRFGLLAGLGTNENDHVRFAQNQAALLDALLASQSLVDYDRQFVELRDKFDSFKGVVPASEPKGFEGELRGYQREGLGWLEFLQEFRLGGCLADDMGLGKTVQFLALLLQRRADAKKHVPSLVVVPKSLLFNWRQESQRFTPQLKILDYTGLDRERLRGDIAANDLVLTTYGTLRRDILTLKEIPFDYVVLDEAQTIKNAGSQVAKAVRLLKAEHRVALTGTPIENHVGDLWSIFEFLNPGLLGRSSIFKLYAADAQNSEIRGLLSQGLRPFILRRTKEQVASELPEKVEQTILCDMRKSQKRLYAELRDGYRASLLGMVQTEGFAKTRMHVLEALLRLRQAACHPALLGQSTEDDSSAKLDVLCPHLEELIEEGHKALVFSQFTSMLAIVKRHLDRRQITYEYLDGQTRDRKRCVDRFQNDADCGVFLISLKAGGFGLNLTAADYVFLLDPWWNPAVEAQAIDRAHRLGQTRQVFAYRLICRDTVEEKIAELQAKKRDLADAILEADSRAFSNMSPEDLELLLS
jgi:SNF2 family DNA or RNA helicase